MYLSPAVVGQPTERQRGCVTIEQVADQVELATNIPITVIRQWHRRGHLIVLARELLVYVARRVTFYSYPDIAGYLGTRHSSLIDAHERMKRRLFEGETIIIAMREVPLVDLYVSIVARLGYPPQQPPRTRNRAHPSHHGGSSDMPTPRAHPPGKSHRDVIVARREKALQIASDVEHAFTVLRHKAVADQLTLRTIDAARDALDEAAADLNLLREEVS